MANGEIVMLFFCHFQIYFSTISFLYFAIHEIHTVNGHPFHHPYAQQGILFIWDALYFYQHEERWTILKLSKT
jgi:hypothetical protein